VRMAAPAAPSPLLELSGNRQQLERTRVRLTPLGEEVLAGRASFLAGNALDEWVGGVHLSTAHRQVWFDDESSSVPRR
jgi:hypothetical protein